MQKQQSTENNYRTFNRNVQLLISEEFAEREIPANDSVRLLEKIVEEMDLRSLFGAYKRRGRKAANNPATMLKILLYANMEGIYSSRDIERACKRDINFIWLLNGAPAPNYKRISEFRSERLPYCSEELFYGLVNKLKSIKEIEYEHLFVDGTKLEANANKYTFVWKKSTTKYETRLLSKLVKRTAELCNEYGLLCKEPEQVYSALKEQFTGEYVHGRGKRKTQIQRDIEELESMLTRKAKYENYQGTFNGRNSFSKTDPDATFIHTP